MVASSRWTGAGGDYAWYDALNWSNGIPVAGENAVFNDHKTWFIRLEPGLDGTPDTCGTLVIADDNVTFTNGELDFAPTTPSNGNPIDFELKDGATFTLAAGAKLVGSQTMELGETGAPIQFNVYGTVDEEYAILASGEMFIAATGHWVTGLSGIAVGGGQTTGASLEVAYGGRVDGGTDGLSHDTDQLEIGDPYGVGKVQVVGAGSRVTLAAVYVGEYYYDGYLTISGGGVVTDEVGVIAVDAADGYVTVSGQGSRWDNLSALSFGEPYPTNSYLTVTDHGEVDWGANGFELRDTLNVDGSATIHGQSIYDGGELAALAGQGNVTLDQRIYIFSNWLFQDDYLAAFSSDAGVSLTLDGRITGDAFSLPATVFVGSGDVVLAHAANQFQELDIYSATVEAAVGGALGASGVEFTGGMHAADLQIDAGVIWRNVVSGFGAADEIDLRGFAYADGLPDHWIANTSGAGGVLVIGSTADHTSIHFATDFTASSFAFSADAIGGTIVKLAAAS